MEGWLRRHQAFQIRALHAPIECVYCRSRQQVALRTVAVEIDSAEVGAERRRAGIRKIESESPRQFLSHLTNFALRSGTIEACGTLVR
jgi:hypothetical protein